MDYCQLQQGSDDEMGRPMGVGRRITLRDIATAAGVSAPTVSNVLSGKDQRGKVKVSPATRERVLRVADELGYTPSLLGQSIRLGRTNQVCIVPHYLHSPWTTALVDAVTAACHVEGKRPLILADHDWPAFLAGQGADGAILDTNRTTTAGDLQTLRRLASAGVTIVLFDDQVEPDGFDVVYRPVIGAFQRAVTTLTTRHRRIALLAADADDQTDERIVAYRAALKEGGLRYDRRLVRSSNADRYGAFRQTLDLLASDSPPTAIVGTQDLSAIGALWAAQRLGVEVPDDLEILGIGNTPEVMQTVPQLSSVGAAPYFDDVAELLMQRLRGEGPPERRHIYRSSVWHRGTTRASEARSSST
jgi:LacI family transcriptional regulator